MDRHAPSSALSNSLRLESLPSDVWDALASVLHGCDLVALWKCGNAALSRKLASEARSVHLEDGIWHSTSRFPKFILQLRNLRSLSLSRSGSPPMPVQLLSQQLRALPSSLESLELNHEGASDCLLAHAPSWAEHAPRYVTTSSPRGSYILIDMPRLFPRLMKLHIKGGRGLSATITSTSLIALPSTLRSLVDALLLQRRRPHLPPSRLASADCEQHQACRLQGRAPARTPSESHFLGITSVMDAETLRLLPRSLTESSTGFLMAGWNLEMSQATSPGMRSILVRNIDTGSFEAAGTTWCAQLPMQLTVLRVQLSLTLTPSDVACLPKTITWLTMGKLSDEFFINDARMENSSSSSSHSLQSSSTSAMSHIHASWDHIWPPTLSTLEMQEKYFETDSKALPRLLGLLPPSITTLGVRSPTPQLDNHRDGNLPIYPCRFHLTSLTLELVLLNDFSTLPSTLTHLVVGVPHIYRQDPHAHLPLPQGLKSLSVTGWRCDWFEQLPRGLTSLSLLRMSSPNADQTAELDLFAKLPANLEKLDVSMLHGIFLEPFSASSFSALHHLIDLDCLTFGVFPSAVVRSLPRGLRLSMTLEALTPEDAAFLPPRLTFIDVAAARPNSRIYKNYPLVCETFLPEYLHSNAEGKIRSLLARASLYPDPRTVERYSS